MNKHYLRPWDYPEEPPRRGFIERGGLLLSGLAIILIGLLAVGVANAGTVKLTIQPNTMCEGGAPIAECPVTGWEIQHATEEWEVFEVVRGIAANTLNVTLTAPAGKHCYRVRPNSERGWGALSNIICVTVPASVPGAPVITVEITVSVP